MEKWGRTVEEAVAEALAELGIGRDEAEVEVLEEREVARGILGLRREREVLVRVRERASNEEFAAEFVRQVGDLLGLPLKVVARPVEGGIGVEVEGEGVGLLIGRHGQTLEALQLLVGLATSRRAGARVAVSVDVEGYRRKRGEALERLARRMAERVVRTGREVVLQPMPPRERRIVHLALQGNPRVVTSSRGEEPYRQVVIAPAN